jgi:hypothetical protein
MKATIRGGLTLVIVTITALYGVTASLAEDLVVKDCTELMRLAETREADLKTVDTVLGSAIEAGNLERIRNYKLRKAAARVHLDAVLKAIEIKGCTKTK